MSYKKEREKNLSPTLTSMPPPKSNDVPLIHNLRFAIFEEGSVTIGKETSGHFPQFEILPQVRRK